MAKKTQTNPKIHIKNKKHKNLDDNTGPKGFSLKKK